MIETCAKCKKTIGREEQRRRVIANDKPVHYACWGLFLRRFKHPDRLVVALPLTMDPGSAFYLGRVHAGAIAVARAKGGRR